MQKHSQTTHSRSETWKVTCCKTLQQTTFLELRAKICYLQPQGEVIINNVWANLTSTCGERRGEKNDDFSKESCECFQDQKLPFRNAWSHSPISCNLKVERLFAKHPRVHVQRWLWNGFGVQHDTPMSAEGEMLSLDRGLASKFPNKPRALERGCGWLLLFPHLHIFSLLDQLANSYTFLKIKFLSYLLPGLLVWKIKARPLDWVSTNVDLTMCNLSEGEFWQMCSFTNSSIHSTNI